MRRIGRSWMQSTLAHQSHIAAYENCTYLRKTDTPTWNWIFILVNDTVIWRRNTFSFCQSHIHKLTYNPKRYSPICSTVLDKINEFIVDNGIELILYKGGTIERDLSRALDIPSMNIECFEELEKAQSHDPRTEVNCYFSQIVEML